MSSRPLDTLPGFRRRFRITPLNGAVTCEVEDDYHRMVVSVQHDGKTASNVEAEMQRVPWTTCPGAEQKVVDTFSGVALDQFTVQGQKKANCTHLYDLAQLAASHAGEQDVLVYDILVADPDDCGQQFAELRVGGNSLLEFAVRDFKFTSPQELAGEPLFGNMEPWLGQQSPRVREMGRMLRWGMIIAHGRTRPLEQQSDATQMPANCYTFQPERAVVAVRVGEIRDFSESSLELLDNSTSRDK